MRPRFPLSLLAVLAALAVPATASAAFPHVVAPGESLSSVAAADGLPVSQLAAANGLSPAAQLISGSTLLIPPAGPSTTAVASTSTSAAGDGDGDGDDVGVVAPASTPAPSSATSSAGAYVVQPGDTLSAIAARAGMSVAEVAVANGLDPNGLLLSGSVLKLSGGGSGAGAGTSQGASSQPVGVVAQGSSGGPPYPTPERVSSVEIGSIAAANGVPPSLADAIGWQESGFNNDLVSSADARGVMQILPGTWNWIQSALAPGDPLAPASAHDNVRGGVLLLRSLLNSTGGDPAQAAAGYYQGLPSVLANGMFPSTQQYVGNVMALAHQFGGP